MEDLCPDCSGTGETANGVCPICEGSGQAPDDEE